ncbi:hypothetical protein BD779DRAFT_1437255 [Infundibulicybe gibba]|nr:hypothetical protein BD779DRAFT_1437255 [Infundibulicybe gibba]
MGFLKRIFSIGKKNKKGQPQTLVHGSAQTNLRAIEEDEHEAAVGRLLRSSSARFAVVSELDYASLPALPHPINEVIQTPSGSTSSLNSASISQRGTYNVTVHRRQRHGHTGTSTINKPSSETLVTPRQTGPRSAPVEDNDNSQLLGLRSDPSVASLLDMYDEHGRLPPQAFSNSPPSPKKEGRAQARRNGSTLRQLLGNPSSINSKAGNDNTFQESDISWAERFLGDANSVSSNGSAEPRTPTSGISHPNTSVSSTNYDDSMVSYDNPAISSLEVELSLSESHTPKCSPYQSPNPATPQRASQIFGFLTDKRPSRRSTVSTKSLSDIQHISSSEIDSPEQYSRFSSDSSFASQSDIQHPIPKIHDDTPLRNQPQSPASLEISLPIPLPPQSTAQNHRRDQIGQNQHHNLPDPGRVEVIMTGPTKVIVTAPTPNGPGQQSRPRITHGGPRAPSRRLSTGSTARFASADSSSRGSRSDHFTPIPSRHVKTHGRAASKQPASSCSENEVTMTDITAKFVRDHDNQRLANNKENLTGLSAVADLPRTPLRSNSNSSRTLYRTAVTPEIFCPPIGMTPSPASSSELSPVGRQLMTNLRQQRLNARQMDRRRTRDSSRHRVRS